MRPSQSDRFTDAASTLMRRSRSPGTGVSTSRISRTSGGPYRSYTIAFTIVSMLAPCRPAGSLPGFAHPGLGNEDQSHKGPRRFECLVIALGRGRCELSTGLVL